MNKTEIISWVTGTLIPPVLDYVWTDKDFHAELQAALEEGTDQAWDQFANRHFWKSTRKHAVKSSIGHLATFMVHLYRADDPEEASSWSMNIRGRVTYTINLHITSSASKPLDPRYRTFNVPRDILKMSVTHREKTIGDPPVPISRRRAIDLLNERKLGYVT